MGVCIHVSIYASGCYSEWASRLDGIPSIPFDIMMKIQIEMGWLVLRTVFGGIARISLLLVRIPECHHYCQLRWRPFSRGAVNADGAVRACSSRAEQVPLLQMPIEDSTNSSSNSSQHHACRDQGQCVYFNYSPRMYHIFHTAPQSLYAILISPMGLYSF